MNLYQLTQKEDESSSSAVVPKQTKKKKKDKKDHASSATETTTTTSSIAKKQAELMQQGQIQKQTSDNKDDRKRTPYRVSDGSTGVAVEQTVRHPDKNIDNDVQRKVMAHNEARESRKQKSQENKKRKGRNTKQKGKSASATIGHIYINDDDESSKQGGGEDKKGEKMKSGQIGHIHIDEGDEEEGFETTTTAAAQPGAIRIPARQPTDHNSSFVSRYTVDSTELSTSSKVSPGHHHPNEYDSFRRDAEDNASPYLAKAYLVEKEKSKRNQHDNNNPNSLTAAGESIATSSSQATPGATGGAPLVEASPLIEEEKPWYTKKWFVLLLLSILIVTIVIAVAVPLATKGDGGPPVSSSPSISLVPSVVPSARPTFAPTMTIFITAVIQLDSNPSDTSWRIDCENGKKNLINIPPNTYIAPYSKRRITHPFQVGVGDTCIFRIEDASKNGLQEDGFYRIFLGTDYSGSSDSVVLVDGDGNFGDKAIEAFEINSPSPPPTPDAVVTEPSISPAPTLPKQSLTPTNIPNTPSPLQPAPVAAPNPPPFGFLPTFPTGGIVGPSLPTSPTTAAPVIQPPPQDPEPTLGTTFVSIQVTIQFDELPSETGWSLACNDETLENITANTYSEPNGQISDTFQVALNADCIFEILDTFGDGICCTFGNGFYQIVLQGSGGDESDIVLVNRTGINPFDVQTISFLT